MGHYARECPNAKKVLYNAFGEAMTETSEPSTESAPNEPSEDEDEIVARASIGDSFVVKRTLSVSEKTSDSSQRELFLIPDV